jgi:serine protease Do
MWAATAAVFGVAGFGTPSAPSAQVKSGGNPKAVRMLGLAGGQGGRIGVQVREVDTAVQGKGPASGVVIEEVQTESPASKAGLKPGDVVVEFDGERVRSTRQFARLVQESVPGRPVPLVVLRDNQRSTLSVEPDASSTFRFSTDRFGEVWMVPPKPPAPPEPPAPADPLFRFERFFDSSGRLGVTVDTLTPQLAQHFGVTEGVLVTSVTENSGAGKAGLKAGDVITALDGATVSSPADLRRRSQRIEDGAEFTLAIVRDRKPLTLKGKVEARQPRRWTEATVD